MGILSTQNKNGEYLDTVVSELVMKSRRSSKNARVVASLTCLQFTFAIYATFLLYFMSPNVDLMAVDSNGSWARHFAKRWQGFLLYPMYRRQLTENTNFLPNAAASAAPQVVCEYEHIEFQQKKSNDTKMLTLKSELFNDIMHFQQQTRGTEKLEELLALPSAWSNKEENPKITVILNHFKRRTLCAQLNALKQQTIPFHNVWVLAFGSPKQDHFRRIVERSRWG